MTKLPTDPKDWFLTQFKIKKKTQCWIWQGPIDRQWNRAKIPTFYREKYNLISTNANRAIYAVWFPEKFNPDLLVCHGPCNNGICINPDHLHQGTHKTNAIERSEYGNALRGSNTTFSKLNIKQIKQIRKLVKRGLRTCEIRKLLDLNISWQALDQIVKNRVWRHIK